MSKSLRLELNNRSPNAWGSRHFPGVRYGVKPAIDSGLKDLCEGLRWPPLVSSQPKTDDAAWLELERYPKRSHRHFFWLAASVIYDHSALDAIGLSSPLETVQERRNRHLPVAKTESVSAQCE